MALKQYKEAARTAIIIAREEQCSGKSLFSDVAASLNYILAVLRVPLGCIYIYRITLKEGISQFFLS